MTCHACGAPLAATAKFCHKCGAQVGGGQAAAWRVGLPWGVAGAALGALLTVVVFRLGTSTGDGRRETGDAAAPASRLSPPDISQMSPEERATRLYNRVMILHSQGKADSAEFFLPMALQAYAMLLRNEAAERARRRPEYAEHKDNLDAFHTQATQVAAGRTRAR